MGLALAIVLQAKQDIRRGARAARVYLSKQATDRDKRRAVRVLIECKAESAIRFFESPLWHQICDMTDSGVVELPLYLEREMYWIRKALRQIGRDKGRVKVAIA